MEENKEKRVLKIELDDEVKKVSITGMGSDEKVVMRQELDEEDLDQVAGGGTTDQKKCIHDFHETAPCQCIRATY